MILNLCYTAIFVFALFVQEIPLQLLILAAVVCSYLLPSREMIGKFPLRMAAILIMVTLGFHLLLRFESDWLLEFKSLAIYEKAFFFALRNAILFLLMYRVVLDLSTKDFPGILADINARLQRRRIDLSILIQPLIIALLYKDVIKDEFQSIRQMHRILGLKRPSGTAAGLKWYAGLILPLIAASFERSEHLAIALTSRGFGLAKNGRN